MSQTFQKEEYLRYEEVLGDVKATARRHVSLLITSFRNAERLRPGVGRNRIAGAFAGRAAGFVAADIAKLGGELAGRAHKTFLQSDQDVAPQALRGHRHAHGRHWF